MVHAPRALFAVARVDSAAGSGVLVFATGTAACAAGLEAGPGRVDVGFEGGVVFAGIRALGALAAAVVAGVSRGGAVATDGVAVVIAAVGAVDDGRDVALPL
jgi:hypothetical protein